MTGAGTVTSLAKTSGARYAPGMMNRQLRASRIAVVVASATLLAGCASSPPADSAAPSASPSASAEPTPTATAEPDPLLVISGTVADQDGQSLAITLTTTSVREPSEQDRADYAATRCAVADPTRLPPDSPDARVVTMSVESVASPGFAGWEDDRGVLVHGSLFDGPIWAPMAHGSDPCYSDSRIVRPGNGEVRVFTSSTDWNLTTPVTGDAAITLAQYGFAAQTIDALGQPTGVTAVADCTTTPSTEFDTLALELWDSRWGRSQNLPEYCFYGRNAGD